MTDNAGKPLGEGDLPQWRRRLSKTWNALNAGSLVAVKVLIVALVGAFLYNYFHEGIVIRPISVPTSLRDEGISDVVAADELRQRIYGIRQSASLNDNPRMPVALSAEQPDIDVPTTSISMSTVFDILASVLPSAARTVISGDFTGDAKELRLVVLVNGREVYAGPPKRPTLSAADELLADAAEAVVANTHPDWEALALDHAGHAAKADRLMDVVINKSSAPTRDVAEAHLLRGMFLREEKKFSEACAEFKASLEIDPANPDAYRDIAALLEDEGQGDAAIAEAQKAVTLSWGRDSWDYYALGTSYYMQGKLSDAERAYGKAIHLWYENGSAHDALGLVRRSEGDYKGALSEFGTAIALNSSFVDARVDRGTLLINKYRTPEAIEEAREDFAMARQSAPQLASPEVGLGYVNYERKQYVVAASYFVSALHRDPTPAAYSGAINALENQPWVSANRQVRNELAVLEGAHGCGAAMPARISGQTILHDLASVRCRMDAERRSLVPHANKCQADAAAVSLWPSAVMLFSFGAVDQMSDHRRLAAPLLIVFGGFTLLGWRSLRRTVKPNGRGTASDTTENRDHPEPRG